MRTENYVERLLSTARDPNADPERVVRMLEGFHNRIAESESGRKALETVTNKLARRIVRQAFRGIQ